MSLCVVGATTLRLAAALFTLSWTHSVQKTGWEEDWRVAPEGLALVEARVKGSGAGMEAGEGARLVEGWWRWSPRLAPQRSLALAVSDAVPEGWLLCANGECVRLDGAFGGGRAIRLEPCD